MKIGMRSVQTSMIWSLITAMLVAVGWQTVSHWSSPWLWYVAITVFAAVLLHWLRRRGLPNSLLDGSSKWRTFCTSTMPLGTHYKPAKYFLWFGIAGLFLALLAVLLITPGYFVLTLLLLTSGVCLAMACQPVIEVHSDHLLLNSSIIYWPAVRRINHTGFMAPLILRLTLADGTSRLLIYSGDLHSCQDLLVSVLRLADQSLIDGLPYRDFWAAVEGREGQ